MKVVVDLMGVIMFGPMFAGTKEMIWYGYMYSWFEFSSSGPGYPKKGKVEYVLVWSESMMLEDLQEQSLVYHQSQAKTW